MGIQIVQYHPHHRSIRVGHVNQPLHLVGEVLHGASDRLPIRFVIFGFALVGCTAAFIEAFADNLALFYLSAALAGVAGAGGAVLNFAVLGVYFGRRNFGTILTVFVFVTAFVSGVAPGLFGLMKNATGDWTFAILGVVLLSAVTALPYLFLGTPRSSPSQLLTAAVLKR